MKPALYTYNAKEHEEAVVLMSVLNKSGIHAIVCGEYVYIRRPDTTDLEKLMYVFICGSRERTA